MKKIPNNREHLFLMRKEGHVRAVWGAGLYQLNIRTTTNLSTAFFPVFYVTERDIIPAGII